MSRMYSFRRRPPVLFGISPASLISQPRNRSLAAAFPYGHPIISDNSASVREPRDLNASITGIFQVACRGSPITNLAVFTVPATPVRAEFFFALFAELYFQFFGIVEIVRAKHGTTF